MDIGFILDGIDIFRMILQCCFYFIVGVGVFGVFIVYYLIQKYFDVDVMLVDCDVYDSDNRVVVLWDWNKVVCVDYDDLIYCKLVIEV